MFQEMLAICTVSGFLLAGAVPSYASGPFPETKSDRYASNLQYAGGSGTGYRLEQIRWGDHHNFERIVLQFSPPPGGNSGVLPRMKVETEYYPMRLAVRLPGSSGRNEDFLPREDLFRKSRLLSAVDVFEVCGGGQHLALVPARPVEFEVFTLPSPPRLVIDVILSRMSPMREERKFSLRTLPLFGDQVCLFLDEAAAAGVTPRLITDAGGNVFGELGLYDDSDGAFAARGQLNRALKGRFSLVVKPRGMMAVPAVLP